MFSCKTQDVTTGLDDDGDDGDLDPEEEEAAPTTSTSTSTLTSTASSRLPPLLGRELKEEAVEEASAGQEVARE